MRPFQRPRRFLPLVALACALAPVPAHAYRDDTHEALALAALNRLPPAVRAGLASHTKALRAGVTAAAADAHAPDLPWMAPDARVTRVAAATDRLRSLGPPATPFLAYSLGRLAVDVAHVTEPYGLYGGRHAPAFLAEYEALFAAKHSTGFTSDRTVAPADDVRTLLTRAARQAAARQALVRADAGRGFTSRSSTATTAADQLNHSATVIARVWMAVLAPGEPSSADAVATLRLSLDQVRFGVREATWGDVAAGLERLAETGHTVPLTPGNVGPGFFVMYQRGAACDLYTLAQRVDPHNRRVRQTLAACRVAIAAEPATAPAPPPDDAYAPGTLSSAESTGIRAFRHRSGTVFLTNRPREMGDAFVPLNFEPIRRYPEAPPTPEGVDLEAVVRFYAEQYALDRALVKAVIYAESDFNPHLVSRAGARGLMQLMPDTALEMGVEDIFDPVQNVAGGTQYLSMMLRMFDDDLTLALAAYNAGPGTVMRYGGVPPYEETRTYVPKVLAQAERYRQTDERVSLRGEAAKPDPAFLPADPVLETGAIVVLRNGLTMRGLGAVEVDAGVRLELETGWILVPARNVERVVRAAG